MVPDHEHSGKPSQACNCFAAGQPFATAVLLQATTATHTFNALARDLLKHRDQLEQADASILLGLWRLANDDIMLVAVELEGSFATDGLKKILQGLPQPILASNIITAPAFDAAQASKLPGVSPELACALRFYSS